MELSKYNFVEMSQKYLKFFMKIRKVRSLEISIQGIEEAEILFSVLFHILDHHSQTVSCLAFTTQNVTLNHESKMFF